MSFTHVLTSCFRFPQTFKAVLEISVLFFHRPKVMAQVPRIPSPLQTGALNIHENQQLPHWVHSHHKPAERNRWIFYPEGNFWRCWESSLNPLFQPRRWFVGHDTKVWTLTAKVLPGINQTPASIKPLVVFRKIPERLLGLHFHR